MSSEASSTPVTGSCLCGNVTYKIDAPLSPVGLCHCEKCRRTTGAAYNLAVGAPRAAVSFTGETKDFITVGGSGKNVHNIFCPNCGSPLWSAPDAWMEMLFVKAGTLSVEVQKTLRPDNEVFAHNRLPYITERYGKQN